MTWRDYQARQKVAELGDRFVSYIDEGRGEAVVLIHGIPTWGYLWADLVPALAETRRVLVPDLIGFGYSDRSDRFGRSIARQAEILDAWLAHSGSSGPRSSATTSAAGWRFGSPPSSRVASCGSAS